jgi:hypothetical protein
MIRQTGGQSWGALNPTVARSPNGELETQAMVRVAEIVQAADDVHPGFQGFSFANQSAGFADQAVEPLTESGIEALDESGVDHTLALGCADQALHHLLSALDNASGDVQLTVDTLFDNLNNGDIRPRNQPGASPFAMPAGYCCTKRAAKGGDIAGQTIYCQKQRPTQSYAFDLVSQALDQFQVAVSADYSAQPQAGRYHHG